MPAIEFHTIESDQNVLCTDFCVPIVHVLARINRRISGVVPINSDKDEFPLHTHTHIAVVLMIGFSSCVAVAKK